uniref:Uncharacterized protein n=1 Tax=Eutreptiella gymnastica TaxID=73025 RepID=A0A7S1J3D0_9EUGL|mmetsp:Transcript_63325/g.112926  ORF Transcript_63325/g.112926 Transcript_63325/m.112926 type:complete len:169 (+) Transcript_63325:59-565(+)
MGGADPLFNGSGVARSIQHMRNYHRISCGPEPMQAKVSGAPMHPWAMYTDKGAFFEGVGTQLKRRFWPKFFALNFGFFSGFYALTWLYSAAGPRAKTHTRKWKLAEAADPRYPYEEFPDIWLPPDIDKDPKADCWRILHVAPRDEKIIMEAHDQAARSRGMLAKFTDN